MKASVTSDALTPANEGQRKQIVRMFQDAVPLMIDKADMTFDGAQRGIDGAPAMLNDFRDAVRGILAKHTATNKYASEEASSNYAYPAEYRGPRPIAEQIETLAKMFGLDPQSALAYAEHLPELPAGAEGWFAFPRQVVLTAIHSKIAETRPFHNWREKQMDSFRTHARTVAFTEKLVAEQGPGDILIVAAQLGMRHRGCSTRRADEKFVRNEFGLTAEMGAAIALTHPERFVRWEELDMDLPGTEFDDPGSDDRFDRRAYLSWNDGEVKFGTHHVSDAYAFFGSASGFLP